VRSIRGVRVAKGASARSNAKTETETKAVKVEEEKPQPKIGESLFGVKPSASSTAPANPFSNPFSSNAGSAAPANPFASSSSSGASPFAAPPAAPAIEVTSEQPKDEATTTLPETFAQKARISTPTPSTPPAAPQPHEPWPAASAFPQPFPYYSLDAEYETLDASAPAVPQNVRIMDIDGEGNNSSNSSNSSGKEDKEIYESAHDAVFQKFADRVGQNPEQILRYEFKGRPLLYSDADAVGKALAHAAENGGDAKVKAAGAKGAIPRCGNCGAERVFEVQLTPHAITELEAEEMSLDGMEWGTIVVGVCGKDCKPKDVAEGEVGYVEEWAGVQWEEVARK
jgi:pre-rRNA-processing protein TSR4